MRQVRTTGIAMAQILATWLGAAVGVADAARPVAVGSAGMVTVMVVLSVLVIGWWLVTVTVLTPVMVISRSVVMVAVVVDSSSGVFARGLPGIASQGLNLMNSPQLLLEKTSVSDKEWRFASVLYETSTWGLSVGRLEIVPVVLA